MKQEVTQDTAKEYWLFQYTEGVRVERPFEASSPGERVPWKTTRYVDRMKPGDIVFFWRAGKTAGLRGWGVIDGVPEPSKGETFLRVPVRTGVNLPEVVPRDEVRAVPEVSDLGVVMQGRQGTNFVLSTRQAVGLARLIAQRGFDAPDVSSEELAHSARRRVGRGADRLEKWASGLDEDAVPGLSAILERVRQVMKGEAVDPELLNVAAKLAAGPPTGGREEVQSAIIDLYGELALLARTAGAPPDEAPDDPGTLVRAGEEPRADDVFYVPPELAEEPPPDDPWIWPWEQRDRVGIGEPVQNLARYIAHEDLVPPRAIGLFGDWGSGKTFFMKALQSQIALLAWASGRAHERGSTSVFCSRVVQIHFNAWHYVESNLWASLAGHIFEKLHDALADRGTAEEPVDVDRLFRALATYREAAGELDRIEERVRTIEDVEIPALKKTEAEAEASWRVEIAALATTVRDEIASRFSDKDRIDPADRKKILEVFNVKQAEELADAAGDLRRVVADGERIGARIGLYLRSWTPRHYVMSFLVVAIAALAIPILTAISGLDSVMALSTTVGGYIALATGALSWLAARGRSLVKTVEGGLSLIEEAREAAQREKGPELTGAEAELAAARAEREQAEQRLRQRRDELVELQARFREQNVGVQLRTFLEDRVRNRSYEQHLGLVSMVRRDLEKLTDLMSRYWRERRTGGGFIEMPDIASDGEQGTTRVPFIERIVLYIDDLDRCPAQKVLEVLQAVHLMLGFKLFVVVVAADVRWIGRSLVESYPALLAGGIGTGEPGSPARAASADDYLEKIFQIPFRIPPMDPESQESLVVALLEERFLPGWDTEVETLPPVPDLNPTELSLYPDEIEAISDLHSCLGRTPRTVKRFVEVYRLMRAGMNEGDVEVLMRTGQYRAILAVLALLSGSPRVGPALVEALHRDLVQTTPEMASGLSAWFDHVVQNGLTVDLVERRSATAVLEFLQAAAGDSHDDEVRKALITWIPLSIRYSFREVALAHA